MISSKEIWPASTGILDLPANWRALARSELDHVRRLWQSERAALQGTEQLAIFAERMAREWAIETGVIENLYELDRGVTQTLIEHGFQSALLERGETNKPREYVIRLLQDQKDALEGMFSFVKQDRTLTISYVKELHAAMTHSQAGADSVDPQGNRTLIELLRGDWKRWPNYPMKDGVELRYCPPEHTASEMDRLIAMHSNHMQIGVSPDVESAWLHHRFTQIHPFQDGNGRVARALASLVFLQEGLFPLVVTRDEKVVYLDALEAADAGDLSSLVDLFAHLQISRFRRATNLLDKIQRPAQSMDEALRGLERTVASRRQANGLTASRVVDLRDLAGKNLTSLSSTAASSFGSIGPDWGIQVQVSGETDSDRFLEMARFAGANAFGVLPIRPCGWAAVEYRVPQIRRMVIHFSGVDPNLDGLVQATAFAEDSSRSPAVLSDEPLDWYPDEDEASIVNRLDDWVERVFIRSLGWVQEAL